MQSKSYVPTKYPKGPSTRRLYNLHATRIPNRRTMGNTTNNLSQIISAQIKLFIHINRHKRAGQTIAAIRALLFPSLRVFNNQTKIPMFKLLLHLNHIQAPSINNNLSAIRVFMRFVQTDPEFAAYLPQFITDFVSVESTVCAFCELLAKLIIDERDVIELYSQFIIYKVTEAEKTVAGGTVENYWHGLCYFAPLVTNNTTLQMPTIDQKMIQNFVRTIPPANRATDPFDSSETLLKLISEGFMGTASASKLYFWCIYILTYFTCIRIKAALKLRRKDFVIYDKDLRILPQLIPDEIDSFDVIVTNYKNVKNRGDSKSINVQSIPNLKHLNPTNILRTLFHVMHKAIKYKPASQLLRTELQSFFQRHQDIYQKNKHRRLLCGSARMTMMNTMAHKLNLSAEDMKRITYHRSDTLHKVYLRKDISESQKKFNNALQQFFN